MRWIKCFPHRFETEYAFFSTHVRMDGIVTGVLAAYIWHYTKFMLIWKKYLFWIWAFIVIGLLPLFVLKGGSYEMNVFGISTMSISFGGIVLLASCWKTPMNIRGFVSWPFHIIAKIGVYSYSIYLWHMFVLQELYRFGFSSGMYNLIYLITAILLGILIAWLIEKPFLKLRERFFPAKWKLNNAV